MAWKLIITLLAFALLISGAFASTGYNAYYYTNNYKPSVYYSDPYQASAANYAYASSSAYTPYGYAYNNVYAQNLAYNTYANNYRTNAAVTYYSPATVVATYPNYYPNYSAYYPTNSYYYPNYSTYYYPNNYTTAPIGGYTGFTYYNANNGWGFSITRGNVCAIYGYC